MYSLMDRSFYFYRDKEKSIQVDPSENQPENSSIFDDYPEAFVEAVRGSASSRYSADDPPLAGKDKRFTDENNVW